MQRHAAELVLPFVVPVDLSGLQSVHSFFDTDFVLFEKKVQGNDGETVTRDEGHQGKSLNDFLQMNICKEAKLIKAEVLALRLYTSCAFWSINGPLRRFDKLYIP